MSQAFNDGVLMEKFTEIKDTLVRIEGQTIKTNGRVNLHDKMLWMALGALAILTPWAFWLTTTVIDTQKHASEDLQVAVASGIEEALDKYDKK